MATSKLAILIETLYKGKGAQQAAKDMGALGKATSKSSMLQAAHQARSADLSRVMNQLASDVSKGTISVGQATKDFDAYKKALPVLETEETAKQTTSMRDAFSKMAIAVGAAGAAVYAAKKVFDFGAEGAKIAQLGESFDRMNESVWQTPDLLKNMQEATRNTVSEAELMSGILTLSAGASETLAQKLAQASPKLAEIAKAANKLNPTLGTTGFMFESIATGVKRASPMILDNLGIMVKVGDANKRFADSVGKTVDELTSEEKQMALLNEVLESGGRLIEQVGGDVSALGDSYETSAAEVANFTNELKMMVNDGIAPATAGMATLFREMREGREASKESIDILDDMAEAYGWTGREALLLERAIVKYITGVNAAVWSTEIQIEANEIMASTLGTVGDRADVTTEEFLQLATATDKQTDALAGAMQVSEREREALDKLGGVIEEVAEATDEATAKQLAYTEAVYAARKRSEEMNRVYGELYGISIPALNAAVDESTQAYGRFTTATGEIALRNDELESAVARVKLELYGIPLAADEAAGAFGRAAYEMWKDANEVKDELAAANRELDKLEGYHEGQVVMNVSWQGQLANPAAPDVSAPNTTTTTTTTTTTPPSPPPGPPAGTQGEFAQRGLHMTVPPGFNNDNYPIWTSSGEPVDVWRNRRERDRAMGGGNTIIVNLFSGGGGQGIVDAYMVAGAVNEILGARG